MSIKVGVSLFLNSDLRSSEHRFVVPFSGLARFPITFFLSLSSTEWKLGIPARFFLFLLLPSSRYRSSRSGKEKSRKTHIFSAPRASFPDAKEEKEIWMINMREKGEIFFLSMHALSCGWSWLDCMHANGPQRAALVPAWKFTSSSFSLSLLVVCCIVCPG